MRRDSMCLVPVLTVFAILIGLGSLQTVSAQGNRQRDLSKREEQIYALERDARRPRDPKDVLVEVNEDLSRLKALNEGIAANTGDNASLNYKQIVDSSVEIKKRATRLKSSLALPAEEGEEKSAGFKDAEKSQLQPVLSTLHSLIDGFLRNPIFSDSGPLDMRLAAKARRDLEDIIVLSEKLRKNAEKRAKSGS